MSLWKINTKCHAGGRAGEMGKWDKVRRGMETRGWLHAATAGLSAILPFVFSGKSPVRETDGRKTKGTGDKATQHVKMRQRTRGRSKRQKRRTWQPDGNEGRNFKRPSCSPLLLHPSASLQTPERVSAFVDGRRTRGVKLLGENKQTFSD